MPLKLNLHHELDKQAAIKRRDPLKFAGAGIIAIVIGFAGYYLYQLEEAHSLNVQLDTAKGQLDKLKPQAEAAKKEEDALSVSVKTCERMVKLVEGRFYWAPVLATLSSVVPREVQVTRFAGDVGGDSLKHCSITIGGVATGKNPRVTAEQLRKAISESFSSKYKNVNVSFKGDIGDANEVAVLDGQQLPTVDFTILVQLQAGEEEAPPPKLKSKKAAAAAAPQT
jgi:hypothetical protein